jgi:hypothetical protein
VPHAGDADSDATSTAPHAMDLRVLMLRSAMEDGGECGTGNGKRYPCVFVREGRRMIEVVIFINITICSRSFSENNL